MTNFKDTSKKNLTLIGINLIMKNFNQIIDKMESKWGRVDPCPRCENLGLLSSTRRVYDGH